MVGGGGCRPPPILCNYGNCPYSAGERWRIPRCCHRRNLTMRDSVSLGVHADFPECLASQHVLYCAHHLFKHLVLPLHIHTVWIFLVKYVLQPIYAVRGLCEIPDNGYVCVLLALCPVYILLLLSAKHRNPHSNSLRHNSSDNSMLVTSPLIHFLLPPVAIQPLLQA